ncbi:MAG: response regulator [Bacteroidota bacterium]
MNILYVDDDEEDRQFFREALHSIDPAIHCSTAANGLEALEKLRRDELPDCIFLDVRMHLMDGKTCLREIKKDSRLRHIPVIMTSIALDRNMLDEYFALGVSHFFIKPNNFPALRNAIVVALEHLEQNL